jgi:phosphoribosylformimino-5-aminoimidazole carboxamide ribonucleotide (ProFAR) isomerase
MSHLLETIPEVAVAGGRCLLPPQTAELGKPGEGNPREALTAWRKQGAHSIVFFDADAAAGTGDNIDTISDAAHHASGHVRTTYLGGVRDAASLSRALAAPFSRIVIDVCDAADRGWAEDALKHHQQRVLAGINVHGTDAVTSAGAPVAGLFDLLDELEASGVPRYLVSEVSGRDHWFHKDRHMLAAVCESVHHPVEARGAVKHDSDIHALAPLTAQGLEAVVVGKPLSEGAFTLQEAVTAAEARYDPYIWAPPQP